VPWVEWPPCSVDAPEGGGAWSYAAALRLAAVSPRLHPEAAMLAEKASVIATNAATLIDVLP
jgi:hypothetical protein